MTEDCIAMSEDGSWAAYPKTMKRGQVFPHIARESYLHGLDMWELTHHYKVRAGFVHHETKARTLDPEWWYQAAKDCQCADCIPCWIVTRNGTPT